MQNIAIVPKGTSKGLVYRCKSHSYRSFDFGRFYHEEIKDLMTGTPILEWVKTHADDWELVGCL